MCGPHEVIVDQLLSSYCITISSGSYIQRLQIRPDIRRSRLHASATVGLIDTLTHGHECTGFRHMLELTATSLELPAR